MHWSMNHIVKFNCFWKKITHFVLFGSMWSHCWMQLRKLRYNTQNKLYLSFVAIRLYMFVSPDCLVFINSSVCLLVSSIIVNSIKWLYNNIKFFYSFTSISSPYDMGMYSAYNFGNTMTIMISCIAKGRCVGPSCNAFGV